MNQLNIAINQASKLLTKRVESKLLAVCSISGIAITIEAPSLVVGGIPVALTYTNPLSGYENFSPLARLSAKELLQLEQPILAGLLLSILKYYELVECPMTSAAQNLSLQSVHPNILVDSIRFFGSVDTRQFKYLPHITFTPKDELELLKSSISDKVKNYTKSCHAIVYPQKDVVELEAIHSEVDTIYRFKKATKSREVAEAILRARRTKEATQKELLVEGRKLLKALKIEATLSEKLLSFLSILLTGDFLLTAEAELKDRITKALLKHSGNSKALRMARIINDNATNNELASIFIQPEDSIIEATLVAVEEEQAPKLSFKERLALKLQTAKEQAEDKESNQKMLEKIEAIQKDEEAQGEVEAEWIAAGEGEENVL